MTVQLKGHAINQRIDRLESKLLEHDQKFDLLVKTKRFSAQYPAIEVKVFTKSHDRFLIIDYHTVYHIGASLKDLGKKWFAFSKIQLNARELLEKLNI